MTELGRSTIGKAAASVMMLLVLCMNFPASAFADTLSVDLKANGQDSLTLATSTDSFTVTLSAVGATACQMTVPVSSGVSLNMSSTVAPGDPDYPAIGGSSTFTVTCTDGTDNQSDTVVVNLPATTTPSTPVATSTVPTIDLKVNGSDGPVTLNAGDTFTYSWTSANATACQMTSPVSSGISLSGTSAPVDSSNPSYPTTASSTTLTIVCTDGVNNATDSVVVSLGSVGGGTVPTVDIKANGSDGPVTLNTGDSFTYSWTSTNATSCQMTSPITAAVTLNGTSGTVSSGNQLYPTTASSTTLTIVCTDGINNATDSVVVSLAGPTGGVNLPTVDIKANGSDGPVTINSGDTFTYSWTSTNATACQMTSPVSSGISLNGTSAPVDSSNPSYPTTASSTTLTIVCADGVNNATDSVVVSLGSVGGGSSPTVDVKINGSDGPVTINNGDSWTYSWTSTNATACQMTSPVSSGISLSGTSAAVTPSSPDYPAVGGSTTITVVCTNGTTNATDSAVVTVANGGGCTTNCGGGCTSNCGGGCTNTCSVSSGGPFGTVLPPVDTGAACLFVRDYMRADFNNNPVEVMKLQAFMKVFEGYDYVTINGVYDAATVQAVDAFQAKYASDILTPWGLTAPTHYTYILTLKKINELYCLHTFPLNEAQAQEIQAFHDLVTGLRAQGINPEFPASYYTGGSRTITVPVTHAEVINGSISTSTATSTVTLPIVGIATSTDNGQNSTSTLAAVLFAAPKDVMSGLQCIYEFLLILIVLYILGNVLEDVLYKKEDLTKVRARFYAKWTTIALGIIVAGVVAYYVNEWCLVLPLLIALVLSLVWMALYPKHQGSMKTTKTWILPGKTVTTVETKA